MPTFDVLEDIQKTHSILILPGFHIEHNICPLVFLSLWGFSLPLYNLKGVAIKKCLIFGGHHTSQHKALSKSTVGPINSGGFSLSGYIRSTWFHDLTEYFTLLVKCLPFLSSIWCLLNGILSMIFTSWGFTKALITWRFQVSDFELMRESTVRSG